MVHYYSNKINNILIRVNDVRIHVMICKHRDIIIVITDNNDVIMTLNWVMV